MSTMKTQSVKFLILASIISVLLTACQSNQNQKSSTQMQPGTHKIVVMEVLQTSNYTYLLADENELETWLALPKMEAKEGDIYYYTGGFEMTNFESKEMGRTFESVLFLESVSTAPVTAKSDEPVPNPHTTGIITVEKQKVDIQPAKDGITIADLFAKKDSYEGKTVRIKGQVMKFNDAIMKRNWAHLQDGTDYSGKYDLTVTTEAEVAVGDIVTFEGVVALNKDFGYGYSYEVLLENATLIKE
jgi:hypothetical protein